MIIFSLRNVFVLAKTAVRNITLSTSLALWQLHAQESISRVQNFWSHPKLQFKTGIFEFIAPLLMNR